MYMAILERLGELKGILPFKARKLRMVILKRRFVTIENIAKSLEFN